MTDAPIGGHPADVTATPTTLGRSLAAVLLAATAAACTQNPADGFGSFGSGADGGATSGGTGQAGSDESTDGGPPGTDTGAPGSTGGDPSTSGALSDTGSSDGAGSTTTAGETDGGSTGGEPLGGPYDPCVSNADCGDPGLACLKADQNGAEGFCSPSCGAMSINPPDPGLCPDAPLGVTATVVCLEGLIRSCALDCTGDATCPPGTECLPANNGYGPYCFGI